MIKVNRSVVIIVPAEGCVMSLLHKHTCTGCLTCNRVTLTQTHGQRDSHKLGWKYKSTAMVDRRTSRAGTLYPERRVKMCSSTWSHLSSAL